MVGDSYSLVRSSGLAHPVFTLLASTHGEQEQLRDRRRTAVNEPSWQPAACRRGQVRRGDDPLLFNWIGRRRP